MTAAFNLSQLANFVNSSGQLNAATGLTNTSSLGFATGTLMLFQQTAAPTGWTKQTTHNDKALRVVSGTASSGGTTAFTTVFANQTPTIGATTLSTAQLASHTHTACVGNTSAVAGAQNPDWATTVGGAQGTSGASGSGSSHTHTSSAITLNVQYVDLIIASKN